tara:strand:- start:3803 stop:6175 length:2373 start_codon:yes stop_codon:yes gene_type:complete
MANKTSNYVNENIIKSSLSAVRDNFRDAIGSYWEIGQPDLSRVPIVTGQTSNPVIVPQDKLTFRDYKINYERKVNISFSEEEDYFDEDESQTLPARKTTMTVFPRTGKFGDVAVNYEESQEDFIDFLIATDIGVIDSEYEFFEDHHFSVSKPLSSVEKVIVDDADPSKSADIDIEFKYNFYEEFYEQTIQDPLVSEKQIENVYNYIYDPVNPLPSPGTEREMDPRYWDKKSTLLYKGIDVFEDLENITIPLGESRGYENVYVPYDHTKNLNENSPLSNAWPMNVNVRMKFDQNSILPELLNNHFLAESLVRHTAEDPYSNTPYRIDEQTYDSLGYLKQEVVKRNIKEINALRWFEERLLSAADALSSDAIFLGDSTDGTLVAEGTQPDYHLLTSFIQELATKIESKRRSFEDILNGVPAPSETVAYRISKIDAARPTSDPIQDFWVFNVNNEVEIMDFIDTQVKYSKKYLYVVSAIKAVYGTAYSYSRPAFDYNYPGAGAYGVAAQIDVVTRPTLRLHEIPIYESIGQILEHPPVPPMIDIIPFRGVGDKLRFHMNGGTGVFVADPIILRDRDEQFYNNYRETNELDPIDPITFKNDDFVAGFEIFRIDYHPTSYEDFRNKLRVSVSTDVNPRSPLKASSGAYIESIAPNKKFYYLFRAYDVHNQPSLPSILYRIEMIDDGSTIFPIIEAVDFLSEHEIEKRNKMPSRQFRKLMYIAPKYSHSYFNAAGSDMESTTTALGRGPDVYLGGEQESIWGKKYKVRLISKSTGKKIDFNFEVKHKHIETEKERN